MQHYFLFDKLIEHEKTTPLIRSASTLLEYLNIEAIPFSHAKADVGSEFLGLNKEKFVEHYAYNLTLAANEKRDILCIEQSSFISHALTKDLLENDEKLKETITQRLEKQHLSLNLETRVRSLEHVLVEEIGVEALQRHIKHPFSTFQTALFLGNNACRAKKYRKENLITQLLDAISLKRITYDMPYESDGYEVLHASELLAKQLSSRILLDMFDNAADFALVADARSFVMFDFYQKELEKVAGREIGLGVLSLAELLLLSFGIHDKKRLGLEQHKTAITLI